MATEIFDQKRLDKYDDKVMAQLLNLYFQSGENTIGDLEFALEKFDEDKIRFGIHKLQGASHSAGALQVVDSCEVVRALIHNNASEEEVKSAIGVLIKVYRDFQVWAQERFSVFR